MNSARPIWLATALVSLIVLIVSTLALATRIRDWNAENAPPVWFFRDIRQTEFEFNGYPAGVTWNIDDQGAGDLTVTYGETTQVIPVAVPSTVSLPGLDRFQDWLAILVFADSERLPFEEFSRKLDSGEIAARCVFVCRVPNPGVADEGRFDLEIDPSDWGWGETQRARWSFDFYELLADGTISKTTKRWPESWQSLYRRQVSAYQAGDELPTRNEEDFVYGTWQHDAALRVSPRPPSITMERQALRNAGWTLPTSSAAAVLLLISLGFGFAPERPTATPQAQEKTPSP